MRDKEFVELQQQINRNIPKNAHVLPVPVKLVKICQEVVEKRTDGLPDFGVIGLQVGQKGAGDTVDGCCHYVAELFEGVAHALIAHGKQVFVAANLVESQFDRQVNDLLFAGKVVVHRRLATPHEFGHFIDRNAAERPIFQLRNQTIYPLKSTVGRLFPNFFS